MKKIKTLDDLRKIQQKLKEEFKIRNNSERKAELPRIKIAMATCCIASGSREVMNAFVEELAKRNIDAIVTQTGCMGFCYAEPTVEVTLPGKEPIVFGYVDTKKVNEIIDKYILKGELIDGIIPVNYECIK